MCVSLGSATKMSTTPPKTNMSPENQWLDNVFPIEIVPFQGTFVHVRGYNHEKKPEPNPEKIIQSLKKKRQPLQVPTSSSRNLIFGKKYVRLLGLSDLHFLPSQLSRVWTRTRLWIIYLLAHDVNTSSREVAWKVGKHHKIQIIAVFGRRERRNHKFRNLNCGLHLHQKLHLRKCRLCNL